MICGAVILTIGIGARQSFGIFQKPIAADLKVGRELWSFANALAMLLMGAFSPFVGNIADRFGTARTVAGGGVLYVVGMFMIAFATEGVMLTLGNVLCGIGMAAAGFGPIFGSISRQTPPEKRSIALGVATAGGSFGQFAIVPFASLLQSSARQLAYDHVHPRRDVDADGAACLRTARTTRRGPKARRRNPARQQRRAAGGVPDARLLAAHDRLLRVRFPRHIYRAPSARRTFPTRRSACRSSARRFRPSSSAAGPSALSACSTSPAR